MAGRHPRARSMWSSWRVQTAKRRPGIVLELLAGKCGIGEAAKLLGITEQRVHQLREEALQAAPGGVGAQAGGSAAAGGCP